MITFCVLGAILLLTAILIGIIPVLFIVSALVAAVFTLVVLGCSVLGAAIIVADFAIGCTLIYLVIKGIMWLFKK